MISFAEKSSRFLARLLAVGVLLLGLVSTARADLTTGLVAWYPFDGNASDMSGNGRHGTLHGSVALSADRHGVANKAYVFDGQNDYIELNNPSIIGTRSTFSIFAWVKCPVDANQSSNSIYGEFHTPGDATRNYFLISNKSLNLDQYPPGNGPSASSESVLNFEYWDFVGVTRNGTTCNLYLDGTTVSSGSNAETFDGSNPNKSYIGARGAGTSTHRLNHFHPEPYGRHEN